MRLLVVFSKYPAETFAVAEVDALRDRGIDVVPLSLQGGEKWRRRPHPTRDRAHHRLVVMPLAAWRTWVLFVAFLLRHPRTVARELLLACRENALRPRHLVRTLFVCLKAPAIAEYVRREDIDAVHVFWAHYPAAIIPFVRRAVPEIPVTAFLGAYSLRRRNPSAPRALADADVITTHFDGHVADIRSGWLHRELPVALIYRGLDLGPLRALRRDPPAAPDPVPRIVIVSRLAPEKGVDDGLRTFAILRESLPDATLDIVGDGPCRGDLENLADGLGVRSAVTFHGHLAHGEAVARLAGAAVAMLPSPSEFFPNAVKEAMALGVPCVAYDIPGIAAYDPERRALGLVPVGDRAALAAAAARLIADRDIARARAANAMELIEAFDIGATSARQYALYRALVERRPLPGWVLRPETGVGRAPPAAREIPEFRRFVGSG